MARPPKVRWIEHVNSRHVLENRRSGLPRNDPLTSRLAHPQCTGCVGLDEIEVRIPPRRSDGENRVNLFSRVSKLTKPRNGARDVASFDQGVCAVDVDVQIV